MKLYYQIILFFAICMLVFSCRDQLGGGCDPDEICYTEKPEQLIAELKISTDSNLDSVAVNFYKGNIDDDDKDLLISFLTNIHKETIQVPVGNNYSAEVTYYFPEKTVKVFDGHRINARSYTNCEETCWNWDNVEFELEMKE